MDVPHGACVQSFLGVLRLRMKTCFFIQPRIDPSKLLRKRGVASGSGHLREKEMKRDDRFTANARQCSCDALSQFIEIEYTRRMHQDYIFRDSSKRLRVPIVIGSASQNRKAEKAVNKCSKKKLSVTFCWRYIACSILLAENNDVLRLIVPSHFKQYPPLLLDQ